MRTARLAWMIFFAIYLVLLIAAIPAKFQQGISVDPTWTAADHQRLAALLGVSMPVFNTVISGLSLIAALSYMVLGGLIFWRQPEDRMALITSASMVAFGAGLWIPSLAGDRADLTPQNFLFILIVNSMAFSLFIVLLIFPDGHFVPRWTRWAALVVLTLFIVGQILEGTGYLSNDLGLPVLMGWFSILLGSQIYRYLRVSTFLQRQQTKWVVFGLLLSIAPLISFALVLAAFPTLEAGNDARLTVGLSGYLLWMMVVTSLPVWFAIAILRSRLWDIDLIIRRTIIYATLSVILGLVYFGGVVFLQAVFTTATGQRSAAAIVLSTLAIAILFHPMRKRVQALIDRRFFRRNYNAERTLENLAAKLRDEVDLEKSSGYLLAIVQETMQPKKASLWLQRESKHSDRGILPL